MTAQLLPEGRQSLFLSFAGENTARSAEKTSREEKKKLNPLDASAWIDGVSKGSATVLKGGMTTPGRRLPTRQVMKN